MSEQQAPYAAGVTVEPTTLRERIEAERDKAAEQAAWWEGRDSPNAEAANNFFAGRRDALDDVLEWMDERDKTRQAA
jgi:hypothetical protein